MFRTVDEFELSRTRETPGVYAFHLRAIRRASVGLRGKGPFAEKELMAARSNCVRILERILSLETKRMFRGHFSEPESYPGQGRAFDLTGQITYTHSLRNAIEGIPLRDIPGFVRSAETVATLLPPLYVGITIRQSVQERYEQHKNNHSNRRAGTFGGRLATIGFHWGDVLFSFASQETLDIGNTTLGTLETFLHLLSRPRLGRS